jgi:hypothetical protein
VKPGHWQEAEVLVNEVVRLAFGLDARGTERYLDGTGKQLGREDQTAS